MEEARNRHMGEKDQPDLPIRALHDFLTEIEEEWGRFKNGSLLSIIMTILLMLMFLPRYFIVTIRQPGFPDTLIALGIVVTLLYTIYLSYRQHVFYAKWEKRIALLLHLEEELMGN
jgi:hypothetical protein